MPTCFVLCLEGPVVKMTRPMPSDVPPALAISFYAILTWGLSALLVAFRVLASSDRVGIAMRAVALVWLALPAALGHFGVLADFDAQPPLLMRIVGPMALIVVLLVVSPWGRVAALRLPTSLLVGVQGFRFPLELVLYGLAVRGVLPIEMTLAGYNFDIVTGITALLLWFYVRRGSAPRWLVLVWNLLGLALLVTIVTVAVLSFPAPFGWFEPENRIVAFYPWVLLPTFLVQLALLGHLLLLRKLFMPEEEALVNI